MSLSDNKWKSAVTREMSREAMNGTREDEWMRRSMDAPRGFFAKLRAKKALDRRAKIA